MINDKGTLKLNFNWYLMKPHINELQHHLILSTVFTMLEFPEILTNSSTSLAIQTAHSLAHFETHIHLPHLIPAPNLFLHKLKDITINKSNNTLLRLLLRSRALTLCHEPFFFRPYQVIHFFFKEHI